MKTILLFFSFFFITNSFAQVARVPVEEVIIDSLGFTQYIKRGYKSFSIDEKMTSPGKELKLYVSHQNKSFISGTLGLGFFGLGAYAFSEGNRDVGRFGVITGTALSITSLIYGLESKSHIRKAAILLDENGIGIRVKL